MGWEIREDADGDYILVDIPNVAVGTAFETSDGGLTTIPTLQPDLWPLIDLWRGEAAKALNYYSHAGEPTLTAHRIARVYEKCADQLAEIAGPRYFA